MTTLLQDLRYADPRFPARMMEALLRDLRFTVRSLARRPGWPAIVVLTLGLGPALAIAAALALARALGSVLFEVPAGDPVTLAAVAGLLAGVALVACLIPARRAANLDPQAALRAA